MNWPTAVGLTASVVALVSTGWALWRKRDRVGAWVARSFEKHFGPVVERQLAPLKNQLSPNGGASAVDKLARLDQWREDFTRTSEKNWADIKDHLSEQDRKFYDHLRDHANGSGK